MAQQEQKWDGEPYPGSRQPNFIQKLYDFLALDPHPFADTLYWATDGRQLVIAQPDKLVKEVLPKLFKHDKLSSFGRQLNIYGFSRLFPGRQFKDANGNVSDASVWAHRLSQLIAMANFLNTELTPDPTLHRLSTAEEISAIKRRAAPKLFRTRRLANGQIVRTRAGPAVEAKAREIRENIAESRRHRGSVGSIYSTGTYDDRSPEPVTPAFAHTGMPIGGVPITNEGAMPMSLSFTDKSRLGDIAEGEASQHFSPPFSMEQDRRESLISIDGNMSGLNGYQQSPPASAYPFGQVQVYQPQYGPPQTPFQYGPAPPAAQEHLPPLTPQEARAFQSCPASIHTTPVPARLSLSLGQNHPGWSFMGTESVPHSRPTPFDPQEHARNLHVNTQVTRIAAPAAAPPPIPVHIANQFVNPSHNYPVSPSTGSPSNVMPWAGTPVPGTPHLMPNSADTTMQTQASWGNSSTSFTPTHAPASLEAQGPAQSAPVSPHGGMGTIDPRWVSPISSVWNTPAQTPRGGSPVQQDTNMAATPSQDASSATPQSLDHTPVPPNRVYGTQSYPPRLAERRQMQAPHLWENATAAVAQQEASPIQQHEMPVSPMSGPELMGPPSLPQHVDGSSIGGGKWFQ